MFRLVVRHLHWLARLPGFPQFFDAMLLAWSVLFHRRRLAAMEALEAAVLEFPGMELRIHRFGGVEFAIAGRELGHMHGNGLLDVHVGWKSAHNLIHTRRAEPHHVLGESAWVSFWIQSVEDVPEAVELLRIAQQNGNKVAEPARNAIAAAIPT
jgi:hypothetical protein